MAFRIPRVDGKDVSDSAGCRLDIACIEKLRCRGELDISAISIHAYAHVCDQYALLPSGASMGDGYGPMLVAREKFSRQEIASRRIAVPGTMIRVGQGARVQRRLVNALKQDTAVHWHGLRIDNAMDWSH